MSWDKSPPTQEELAMVGSSGWDSGPPTQEELALLGQDQNGPSLASQAGSYALEKAAQAGQFLDKYTGAPIRAGIGAAQDGKNPITALVDQYGQDASLAPTGKQIAQKAGVSDKSLSDAFPDLFTDDDLEAEKFLKFKTGGAADISASGAAGLGIDIVADPTNLIPGAAIGKGVKSVGQAVKKAAGLAADVASPFIRGGADLVKGATVKAGHALTGVPEQNIATYISKRKAVEDIIAKHGGDMSLAADEVRQGLQNSIQTKIGSLNDEIKTAIKNAPTGSYVSSDSIIKAMEDVKSGINPKLYPESISEIDELITKIKTLPPEMSAGAANEAKRFLQSEAKGSYVKNGQIFTKSKDAQRAAKMGGRQARRAEITLARDTARPNYKLSKLHKIEGDINKNLIAPGKTESALLAAGSGGNARSAKNLKDISNATGYDALSKAQELSSARAFSNPGVLPVDATGKSFTRMAVGATVGSAFGGPIGTMIGMAATSPSLLKKAIQVGDVSADLVKKLAGTTGEISDKVLEAAVKKAQTPLGQAMIRAAEKAPKAEGFRVTNKVADEKKLKGETKWANDGFNKVIENADPELRAKYERMKSELLKNKKTRSALINASDLPPDSKAFQKILKELEGAN